MPALRKDLRRDLENAIKAARRIAEAGAREALNALAVSEKEPFAHMKANKEALGLRNRLRARGRAAGDERDYKSGRQDIEHLAGIVAYEHWHRMIFARFLAENGLLLEPEHGVAVSLSDVEELARDEKTDVWELAGRYAQRMLPEIFRTDDPALQVALPRETRNKLEKLVADLAPETFTANDSLGWTYQFWQADRKDEVNASGKKIGADELPAVTQLFTEDYMVDFLLDNTLGAWHAGKVLAANSKLAGDARSEDQLRRAVALPDCQWIYLRFIKDKEGKWTPAAGTFEGWPKFAKELKCLDPCMGSGHFVVAMFERLTALRMVEEKLDETAAVAAVIRDNLFGLEIDPRCTQIGAFNLALAAWRRVGHRQLPAMNLACSGLAPNTREADWLAIAGDNEKLQRGMERLYGLFQKAAVLGSLINPRAGESDLLVAAFHELQPLLEKALARETKDDTAHEMAVTARGVAKAAEILAGQFTLVATNVPYLGSRKQDELLKDYCEAVHPEAKADLANCFVERCLEFCAPNSGSISLVTPQNWLFLGSYKKHRQRLLAGTTWGMVARLGPKGFQTPMWDFNICLVTLSRRAPTVVTALAGFDCSRLLTPSEKASALIGDSISSANQLQQLNNPDARIALTEGSLKSYLSTYADGLAGILNGDSPHYLKVFWEIPDRRNLWSFQQTTQEQTSDFGGLHNLVYYDEEHGHLREEEWIRKERLHNSDQRGQAALNKEGIAVSSMGRLPVSRFLGSRFDSNVAAVVPKDEEHLSAIWCFCTSPEYYDAVRAIDQALKVTNASLVKVPFDLEHWQKVATEKYPQGLPKPFSSDPTQWLFNGQPKGSDQPLHVAVARLLGYQWPRQTGSSFRDCPSLGPDGLKKLADDDGIVCLPALNREQPAANRLRNLLAEALGIFDERKLLAISGRKGSESTSLEDWLRNEFFEQHCDLFHQRPFIWHLWDGRLDGFHVLVNYHRLAAPNGTGYKLLEKLTYAYLGDWIRRQKDDVAHDKPGAEDRLVAAEALQEELKNILAGEPPYDLFIRWKPLHQQAIGWNPDINDGVRLNIRPFLLASDVARRGAGILRFAPNIKWTKDRGTEPQRAKQDFPWFWSWDEKTQDFPGGSKFDGNRWNDLHYTAAAKTATGKGQTK